MADSENRGIERTKLVLVICTTVMVALTIVNLTFFTDFSQVDELNAQIQELNTQIEGYTEPKLGTSRIEALDRRVEYNFLQVKGWVFNSGRNVAYNSKLHMVAYYINGEVAIDYYLELHDLQSTHWGALTEIDKQIKYDGAALDMSRFTMTLEWQDWTGKTYTTDVQNS